MKRFILLAAIISSFAVAANAGSTDSKSVAPVAPDYGTGFYIGIDGGFNITHDSPGEGAANLSFSRSDLGGFGGIKGGYVFGRGEYRPALETDIFYNGFSGNYQREFPTYRLNRNYQLQSGAFMENVMLRFTHFGAFQPYIGAGIGAITDGQSWESSRISRFSGRQVAHSSERLDNSSWAWQLIGGADYYLKPNLSIFVEYKFLNYMHLFSEGGDFRLAQQLAGVGVRFHF